MKITDLLNAQSVKVGAAAASQADAIDQLVALQVAAGNVSDADGYKAGVLAREAEFSTAVGDGIAIPHAKVAAVAKAGLAAMTVPGGVDWNAPTALPATSSLPSPPPRARTTFTSRCSPSSRRS